MPQLTRQEFNKLRDKGLSVSQIIDMQQGNTKEVREVAKQKEAEKRGFIGSIKDWWSPTPDKVRVRDFIREAGATFTDFERAFGKTVGGSIATLDPTVSKAKTIPNEISKDNARLARAIVAKKELGEDTSNLERIYNENVKANERFDFGSIIPEIRKTKKTIAGEALGVGSTLFAVGQAEALKGAGRVARIGAGADIGALGGLSYSMKENQPLGENLAAGVKGGMIGAMFAGLFEAYGAQKAKLAKSEFTGSIYDKELQTPRKDLQKAYQKGFQKFGDRVRDVVDDQGNPVYKGSYEDMLTAANTDIRRKGTQLTRIANSFDDEVGSKVTRNQVANDIIEEMQDQFGRLKSNDLKNIQFEVSKMPKEMGASGLIDTKRMYDKRIPENAFQNIDGKMALVTQVRLSLRERARLAFNNLIQTDIAQKLNNDMSVAMDVKKLTALQLAGQRRTKVGALVGGRTFTFWDAISKFIDDSILSPQRTTAAAQWVSNLEEKTASTLARRLGRQFLIKEAGERSAK